MSLLVNAHHEAGHAVVAVELGRGIEFASASESHGLVKTTPLQPSQLQRRRRDIVIALAGSAAEVKFFGRHSPYTASSKDFEFARDETRAIASAMGERLDHETFKARLEEARVRSVEIVERRSKAVAAVAVELATRRHLSGRAVRRIVRDHP